MDYICNVKLLGGVCYNLLKMVDLAMLGSTSQKLEVPSQSFIYSPLKSLNNEVRQNIWFPGEHVGRGSGETFKKVTNWLPIVLVNQIRKLGGVALSPILSP